MISMHTSPLAQPGQGDAGGLNVYIRNLAYALIEAGHQVLCFTRRTEADDHTVILDEHTDSKVIPLAVGRLSLPKEALADLTTEFACALVSTVPHHAKHKIVLHSHYWLSGMVAYHAGLALHAPAIHTMHTLGATKNKSAPGTEPAYRIECENFICAHAEVITANTVIEKQELVQHTGVHPDRVTVIHPGVDHRVFRPYGPARWPGRVRDGSPKVLLPAGCSTIRVRTFCCRRWRFCAIEARQCYRFCTLPVPYRVTQRTICALKHISLGYMNRFRFLPR